VSRKRGKRAVHLLRKKGKGRKDHRDVTPFRVRGEKEKKGKGKSIKTMRLEREGRGGKKGGGGKPLFSLYLLLRKFKGKKKGRTCVASPKREERKGKIFHPL